MYDRFVFCIAAAILLVTPPDAGAVFKSGNFDAARRLYAQQVAAQPQNAAALLGLATTELYANELDDAQRDIKRVLALDPSNERAGQLERTIATREGKPGEFAISQHGDAVLPFISQDPLPTVRMRIDGADARVAIDTGGPTFSVSSGFAQAHHLRVVDAGIGTFAGGRHAPVQATELNSISAGAVTVHDVSAHIMPGPGPGPGPGVDAIVGTGFFAHFLTTLDYTHRRLILRSRDAAPPVTAIADVPMWLVGDHFIFAPGSVNGGQPELFNIDSGADIGVQLTKVSLDVAHVSPQTDKPQQFMGGGGAARIFPFTAGSVSLGNATQRNVGGIYFPDGDQYGIFPFTVAGTVSGGFLGHYAVTFDFKRMRLVLE